MSKGASVRSLLPPERPRRIRQAPQRFAESGYSVTQPRPSLTRARKQGVKTLKDVTQSGKSQAKAKLHVNVDSVEAINDDDDDIYQDIADSDPGYSWPTILRKPQPLTSAQVENALVERYWRQRGVDPFWVAFDKTPTMADESGSTQQDADGRPARKDVKFVQIDSKEAEHILVGRGCSFHPSTDRADIIAQIALPKLSETPTPEEILREELWRLALKQCQYTQGGLFQHDVMFDFYDFRSERRNCNENIFAFTSEISWEGFAPPSQFPKRLARPKPDLVVGFKPQSLLAGATEVEHIDLLGALKAFIRPETLAVEDYGRAFPFLIIDAKGLTGSLDNAKTLRKPLNASSWALHGMWRFFEGESEEEQDEFFNKIRVFTISCHATHFHARIHRAVKKHPKLRVVPDGDYPLGFCFDNIYSTSNDDQPYTRASVQKLVKRMLDYAKSVMQPILSDALDRKLNRVYEGTVIEPLLLWPEEIAPSALPSVAGSKREYG